MIRCLAQKIGRFLKSEEGPTAVEYAFLLALILLIAISSITLFGEATNACFENAEDEFAGVMD